MPKDKMLEEIVLNTREILRWLRFQNLPQLKQILKETCATSERWHVYELADGKTSLRKIETDTGVPFTTIRRWLTSWCRLGLIDQIKKKYRKIVSLVDLGIEIPKEKEKP